MRLVLILLANAAVYATTPTPRPACGLGQLAAQAKAIASGNSGVSRVAGNGKTKVTYVDGDNHIEVLTEAHDSGGDFYTNFVFLKRPDGRYDVTKHSRHENGQGAVTNAPIENSISETPPVSTKAIQKINQDRLLPLVYRAQLQKAFIERHGVVFLDFESTKREVKGANDKGRRGWDDGQILVNATIVTLHRTPAKVLAERLVAGIEFTGYSREDFMAHFEGRRENEDTTWDVSQVRYNDVIGALNSPAVLNEDLAKLKKEVLAEVEKTAKFK